MENAIRQLLSKAETGDDCISLADAFEKLKRGRKDGSDQADPFSSDLFVICGQVALKVCFPNDLFIICAQVSSISHLITIIQR